MLEPVGMLSQTSSQRRCGKRLVGHRHEREVGGPRRARSGCHDLQEGPAGKEAKAGPRSSDPGQRATGHRAWGRVGTGGLELQPWVRG